MKIRRGFTLIELLVVIAIIAIIAVVVALNLASARPKARDARRKNDLASIQTALEAYFDANSAYPSAGATSPALGIVASGPTYDANWITDLSPTFISAVPKDPTNANHFFYCYVTPPQGGAYNRYKLFANLENTADEATDGGAGSSTDLYEVWGGENGQMIAYGAAGGSIDAVCDLK